jgi:hypothetical protein
MAYIGQGIKQGTFKVLDTSGNTYNGSNTTFNLGTQVGSAAQLLVSHDGVIQLPGTDYTLATGGTQITFSTAPASGASIFIVEISGAVGGTVTPSDNSVGITQLNVSDGSSGQALTTNGSGTLSFASVGLAGIDDQSDSNDDQLTITDTAVVINEDSDDLDFRVESNGNANMLVVNGGGDRVGIASDPDLGTGLHIKTSDSGASVGGDMDELVIENGSANAGLSILTATDGIGRIAFGDSGDNSAGNIDYLHDGNHMKLSTAGSERVRIDGSGDVSVGTTSVQDSFIVEFKTSGNPGYNTILSTSANVNSTEFISFRVGNTQEIGSIKRNGGADAIAFNTSSDYRLKQDIADIDDGITRLKTLQPRRFKWKSDTSKTVDGFIAHEVTAVPESITGTKDETANKLNIVIDNSNNIIQDNVKESDWTKGKADGTFPSDSTWSASRTVPKYQQIDQAKLVPLLTAALQEAITKIEALEARVTTLEG